MKNFLPFFIGHLILPATICLYTGLPFTESAINGNATTVAFKIGESADVADNFDTNGSYAGTNSTGSIDWSADWIENDASGGGASSGNISVNSNTLIINDNSSGNYASREVDLSNVSTAVLSFDFINALSNNSDQLTVELSKNGGTTYPHVLFVFNKNTTNGTKTSAELVAAIGALTSNTVIRFRVSNIGGSKNNNSTFDNINIAYTIPSSVTNVTTNRHVTFRVQN